MKIFAKLVYWYSVLVYKTCDWEEEGIKKIQDVDPATFEIIKSPHHPYSRDKNNVYYYEHTITGANPETFVILDEGYGYAKDSKSIYYGTKSLKEADLNTFKVINMNTAKDKNNVYRDGEISGENPSKF